MKRGLKKWLVVIMLLLASLPVFAASEGVGLRIGESKEINGVNFTLLRTDVDNEKVVMCINNRKVIISDTGSFGNAIVTVSGVFSTAASFEIDVACDKKCECGEDCKNDACFAPTVECSSDMDCNDNNPNTVDMCVSGICENRPVQLKPCKSDAECNDGNPCTNDQCNTILKKCIHLEIEGCVPLNEKVDQLPEQQPEEPPKSIPLVELSAYVLMGVIFLLFVASIIKKAIE